MGKYMDRRKEVRVEKDHTKSLAWRGIGCLLMIVIPAISIGAALLTLNSSLVAYIPYDLMGYPLLPPILFSSDLLAQILTPVVNTENLYAIIFISVVYMVIIGGVISLLYAIIYRIVNPNKYGPLDAPPPKVRTKKYTR